LTAWSAVARRKPAARLWLAGETPQAAAVAARTAQRNLGGSVSIVGTFDDLELLLPAADVFVSPAPEGGMQPVLEAMAAGLPFVAADVPDNRWLQGESVAGALFSPDDAEALAAAIMGLLDDAGAAQQLGRAGWQRVQRDFTLAGMAEGICKVLGEATTDRENAGWAE
jgi:glycosyltransferase involved in cell wall biosynthesis